MRSWLASGVQMVDRRRRFGSHGRAREMLVADQPANQNGSERWQALAAALHRHTVRGGLSELGPEQRRVITLAYLEGRTNREIAAMLGVSVTTVRRRLWIALGLLEAYIGRTGVWLSALILVAATSALRPATRVGHWVTTAAGSTDRAQRVANTLTAGAMSAAVLGIVAFTSDSITPQNSPGTAKAQSSVAAPNVPSIDSRITQPSSLQPNIVVASTIAPETTPVSEGTAPAGGRHHNNGCDGNPTSAPPPVPVRSLGTGSPVTHPDAGGCRP
ncbi:MAG TPA: RNA polymerase sigma factor [Candidatus Eisenbacteria bacterium]|nr:RNA polymerase sigma factor [Candidatus Eisenbacteria bacterium]